MPLVAPSPWIGEVQYDWESKVFGADSSTDTAEPRTNGRKKLPNKADFAQPTGNQLVTASFQYGRAASGKDALVGSGRTRSVNRPFFVRALSAGGGVAAARSGEKDCCCLRIRTAVRPKTMKKLELEDNPLPEPYPDLIKRGTEALLTYLRSLQKESTPQYEPKLLLLGEGNAYPFSKHQ